MDQLLRTALAQRLGGHLRATVDPLIDYGQAVAGGPGQYGQRSVGDRALLGLRLGTMLPRALVDALGLAREGLDYGSKVATGALGAAAGYELERQEGVVRDDPLGAFMQGAGQTPLNPVLALAMLGKLGLPSPFGASDAENARRAFEQGDGNIVGRFRAANEGLAQESPLATGLVNVSTDPTSYLTGGGSAEARAAQQAGRIGRGLGIDLGLVNQILNPEGQVLEALGGRLAKTAAGKAARETLTENALTHLLRERYGDLLGNAPGPKEYGAYAKELGLPAPGKVAEEASDLAPAKVNIRQLLREANARARDAAQPRLLDAPVERGAQSLLLDDRGVPLAGNVVTDLVGGAGAVPAPLEDILGRPGLPTVTRTPGIVPPDVTRNVLEDADAGPGVPLADNALDLMRELLRSGDQGRGMVYVPSDPAFWAKRTGVDEAAVPGLLGQLTGEGDILERGDDLINPYRAGGPRTSSPGAAPAVPHAAAQPPASGPLTSDELDQLVNIAYPTREAQANAITKYKNPDDLTEAALNRIGQNPDTIRAFAAQYPDLAQRIVDLPDPRMATEDDLAELGAGVPAGDDGDRLDSLVRRIIGLPDESGLLPRLPSRLAVTGSGATLGGTLGGIAPADSEEDRRRNIATGAALGGGVGLGATTRAGQDIIRQLPKVGETARTLAGESWAAQRAAMGRESKGIKAIGDIPNVWSVQTTSTLRNLIQSLGSSALWLKDSGVKLRAFRENMASLTDLYNRGVRKPYDAQPLDTTDILDALGKTGRELDLGKTFTDVNRNMLDNLSALDTALIEGGLAAANPLYGGVPALGVAAGAVKGYFRPALQKVYNTLDNFIELAARHAAWQDEVTPALRVAAADFLQRHGLAGALPADGRFSAKQVEALAGAAAGKEWDSLTDRVIKLGEDRAKDILGDFGNRGQLERLAGKGIPFIGWAVRAYPRTLRMALDHPGASIALMTLMANAAAGAKESGLPGYQVGTLPVGQDTPVLGGLASALTGGQPGEMRLNLVSGLTPVGGSVLEGDDLPEDATPYQQARNALGRTGFAFNPIIQGLMYALNQDYTKPGALSRTATGETVLPGPTVPSLLAGPLNKAREAAGGSVSTATPHDRKLAEIFYRETGHLISDPTNMRDPQRRALLMSTLDPNSPIRQQADREMRTSGAAKLAISLASPVTATARSDQQAATQKARAEVAQRPAAVYDQGAIRAVARGGTIRDQIEAYLMGKANAGTQGDLPDDLLIPQGASGQDRTAAIMDGFQNSYYGGGYYQNYLLQQLLGLR